MIDEHVHMKSKGILRERWLLHLVQGGVESRWRLIVAFGRRYDVKSPENMIRQVATCIMYIWTAFGTQAWVMPIILYEHSLFTGKK